MAVLAYSATINVMTVGNNTAWSVNVQLLSNLKPKIYFSTYTARNAIKTTVIRTKLACSMSFRRLVLCPLMLMLALMLSFNSAQVSAVQVPPVLEIKQVDLLDKQGKRINIGQLHVHVDGQFEFMRNDELFTDHFLSMKEMKCLEGPELWCHVAYPYPLHRQLNDTMAWLSHDLLFMYKKSNQFGAKLWQGVYYKITQEGEQWIGTAQGVDLNQLASAPEQTETPFYDESEMEPHNAQDRWLAKLIIE